MPKTLSGNEKLSITGHPTKTQVSLVDLVMGFGGVDGKLDKKGVHDYLASNDIKVALNGDVDYNDITNGVHFIDCTKANVHNKPSTGIFKTTQFAIDEYKLQEAVRHSTGEMFVRTKRGGTWSEWSPVGSSTAPPPEGMPSGKKGQMLVHNGEKWTTRSTIEVASLLHVNHDSHFDVEFDMDKVRDGIAVEYKVELANNLILILAPRKAGSHVYVSASLSHPNYPQTVSFRGMYWRGIPDAMKGYEHFRESRVTNERVGSLDFFIEVDGKPSNVMYEGVLELYDNIYSGGMDTKPLFIALHISNSKSRPNMMYIKTRTRADFAPYIDVIDPEPPIEV